jgi:hypothetical protein
MARGYVLVDQWHSMAKTWDELVNPEQHTGDAAQINKLWKFQPPKLSPTPLSPYKGEVCLQVEDDGTLKVFAANYDTSD